MRILVATPLSHPDIGGPATHTELLQECLPSQGFTVETVSFTDVRHLPKVVRHAVLFFRLLRKGLKADVVYALDPVSVGFPACIAAFVLKKKFVVRIAGDYAWEQGMTRFGVTVPLEVFVKEYSSYPFLLRLFCSIERWVLRQAQVVAVPSSYLARIIGGWGIDEKKIRVVYNGVEGSQETGNKEVLRQMLGVKGKVIASASRLIPLKNFKGVIEAVLNLRNEFQDLKLLIIGEGPSREHLEALIKKHNLEETVVLTGRLDRRVLFQYVMASDVFVLNSWHETFSHLLLEVMSIGTPIITTRVGGTPEMMEDGKEGLLIPPRDSEALQEALRKLLTDEEMATRLVAHASKRVKDFSLKKEVEVVVSIFKSL